MTNIKHFRHKTLPNGREVYAFDPSKTLRDKLGYKYQQFDDRISAINAAIAADEAFKAFKAGETHIRVDQCMTFCTLWDAYVTSSKWRKLKPKSQRTYMSNMQAAQKIMGGRSVNDFKVMDAEQLYSAIASQYSEHHALGIMKLLSVVFSNATRLELINRNPFGSIELTTPPARTTRWSDSDVRTFVTTADANGMASLGTLASMAYELCQRPVDCREMRWSNYNSGSFTFTQAKTGTAIRIPAPDHLKVRIEQLRAASNQNPDAHIIIYERSGEPFSERLLRKKADHIRKLAGLPDDLKVSDLRRSGASMLGDSGCTEDEIRTITGHRSRQVISTYVLPSTTMAERAQQKRANYSEVAHG
jgi:integrase